MKIKIVHIISRFKMNGPEAVVYELIAHLNSQGFKQAVIYFQQGPHVERLQLLGVSTHHVRGFLFRYDPVFWIRLLSIIKQLRPSCLHSCSWSATLAARFAGYILTIPSIASVLKRFDHNGKFCALVDRLTMGLSNVIVAGSPKIAESIVQKTQAQNVKVIVSGVDAHAMKNQGLHYRKTRYELELSDEHIVIGSVGQFYSKMQYTLLLDSFALINTQYPLTRLVLIGTGPEENALEKADASFRN